MILSLAFCTESQLCLKSLLKPFIYYPNWVNSSNRSEIRRLASKPVIMHYSQSDYLITLPLDNIIFILVFTYFISSLPHFTTNTLSLFLQSTIPPYLIYKNSISFSSLVPTSSDEGTFRHSLRNLRSQFYYFFLTVQAISRQVAQSSFKAVTLFRHLIGPSSSITKIGSSVFSTPPRRSSRTVGDLSSLLNCLTAPTRTEQMQVYSPFWTTCLESNSVSQTRANRRQTSSSCSGEYSARGNMILILKSLRRLQAIRGVRESILAFRLSLPKAMAESRRVANSKNACQ